MRLVIVFLLITFSASAEDTLVDYQYTQAKLLYEKGALDSANFAFEQLLQSTVVPHSLKGQIALSIGGFYRTNFDYLKATHFLERSLGYSDTSVISMVRIDAYNELGLVYFDQHRYSQALSNFSISLQLANEIEDSIGMTVVLINIGNVFKETLDYDNALYYYTKALSYVNQSVESSYKSTILIDIGSVLYLQKQPQKALDVMKEAAVFLIRKNDWLNLAHLQCNMGLCYTDIQNYQAAKKEFETALGHYADFNNKEGKYLCYVNLFYLAHKLKNQDEIDDYLKWANDPQFDACNLQAQLDFAKYKQEYFDQNGYAISAYDAANERIKLQQTFFEDFKNAQLNELKLDVNFNQVKGQLDATEDNLERERSEKALVNALYDKLQRQNKWIILLALLGSLMLISFLLILIRSNSRKKRINTQLIAQNEVVEKKSEEILNSMSYANSMEKLLLQQMNPHFLHNALTTIDASITIGDTSFAKRYLTLFSDLLRKTLDNSREDSISLAQEIDFLKAYIKLNAVKQGDQFECQFIYDEEDVEDFVFTPPMLVQPFIENALVHGLYHKIGDIKKLTIQVFPKENHILWIITDNGVGRIKSKEIGKSHKGISHGIKITVDRIHWMKKRYGNDFSVEYVDLEQGTEVTVKTPILDAVHG